jgi:hypothetical protein
MSTFPILFNFVFEKNTLFTYTKHCSVTIPLNDVRKEANSQLQKKNFPYSVSRISIFDYQFDMDTDVDEEAVFTEKTRLDLMLEKVSYPNSLIRLFNKLI